MPLRTFLLAAVLGFGAMGAVPAQAETSIKISLKDRYLTLLDDGKVIGKYPVAIGAPESPTRPGSYAVTKMDPALCGCRRLSVLMKVDFPDPEGPRITIISPLLTSMSIPFSAQKSPKFTFTPSVLMITSFSFMLFPLLRL